ncbi:hypothetical protein AB0C96_40495 [Streptomyces sp. NPDC048506]|uniref:hypothetical protein n=1 Tax=Streptomyces sp. NPDC048506 TaxID=3155028 RepID=UPI003419583B
MRLEKAGGLYSGVTDDGAQSFVCRGERHVSVAGPVMAFNTDETHDGQWPIHYGYS